MQTTKRSHSTVHSGSEEDLVHRFSGQFLATCWARLVAGQNAANALAAEQMSTGRRHDMATARLDLTDAIKTDRADRRGRLRLRWFRSTGSCGRCFGTSQREGYRRQVFVAIFVDGIVRQW